MKNFLKELVKSVLQEKLRDDKDDTCRKCGASVPAYDVGHAYYYTCPKCGYRWELTEQKIRVNFGEPLLAENVDEDKTTVAFIFPVKNEDAVRLKISDWTDDMFDELKVHFDDEIFNDITTIKEIMDKFNVEWVFDKLMGDDEPNRISTWFKLNEPF